jgi:hypothetical protein
MNRPYRGCSTFKFNIITIYPAVEVRESLKQRKTLFREPGHVVRYRREMFQLAFGPEDPRLPLRPWTRSAQARGCRCGSSTPWSGLWTAVTECL